MIKKLQGLLFSSPEPGRNDRREFNGRLLDQGRDDVYVQMHQQMGGIR